MKAVIRILCYLKYAPRRGIVFLKNNHLNVDEYTNADWLIENLHKDISPLLGNLVTWRSNKQKVIALSSVEVRRLLTEIGFEPKTKMNLFCDNMTTIEITHNPVQHYCTKHIEIDRHFIKENLEDKIIIFLFVQSEDQLVDMLTKTMSSKISHICIGGEIVQYPYKYRRLY
ncbi:hypothetical protein CR513_15612, partial [Mucuna pruriens]